MPDSAMNVSGPGPGDALIVVDVQRDFLPGGALAAPDGDVVVPVLNRYIRLFLVRDLPLAFTRDWHPPEHCSFRSRGGLWPAHCVAGTPGALFAPGLEVPATALLVSKGSRADTEAYSGFQHTSLGQWLRGLGCRRLFIGGLATDYCVRATVRDALADGFAVVLLHDAIRAVNLAPQDGVRAEQEMKDAGARVVSFDTLDKGAS